MLSIHPFIHVLTPLNTLGTPLLLPFTHLPQDVFYTRADFCRLLAYFGDALDHIDVPPPAIVKPRQLWTGKQVIPLGLCDNIYPCVILYL